MAIVGTRRVLLQRPGDGPTVIILDEFSDTNGVSLDAHAIAPVNIPGNTWVENNGDWDIQGNAANNTGVAPAVPRWIATIEAGIANAIVETVVTASSGGAIAGVIGRFVDNDNFWAVRLDVGNDVVSLVEFDTGNDTVRDSAAVVLAAGTPYTVQITFSGTSITATVDGANQMSYSSTLHQSATKFGIHERQVVTDTRFDDFKVSSL